MADANHDAEQLAHLEAQLKRLETQLARWRGEHDDQLARFSSDLDQLRSQLAALAGGATITAGAAAPDAPSLAGDSEPLLAEVVPIAPLEKPPRPAVAPREVPPSHIQRPVPADSWRATSRDGSLEALIGGRWLTWAGAFVLLIALGFTVHWAWSTFQTPDWMQVTGLHLLGLGMLIAAAVAGRSGLPILARALSGLAIFELYAVALATLKFYEFWSPNVAFLEFSLITIGAIVLALRLDSVETILLGALGGYLAPILTSEGSGDHVILFMYLAFLNVALAGCAVWKGWSFLKPLSLVATALMFLYWIEGPYRIEDLWSTQWLVTLHAAIFLVAATLPPWLWKRPSTPSDLIALSGGSMWFLGVTWQLFHDLPTQQLAWVCWGLAALHLVLFAVTYARVSHVDRMPRIQLALAAIFATLAAPLQLDDYSYLGPTWCVEALIFTVVGIYFRDWQMRLTGVLVFLLAVAKFIGWDYVSGARMLGDTGMDIRFVTMASGAVLAMAAGVLYLVLRERLDSQGPLVEFDRFASASLLGGGNILLLLALTCQWHDRLVLVLWTLDAAAVLALGFWFRNMAVRLYGAALALGFVGIQTILQGVELTEPFTTLFNPRFGALALVAGLYFATGFAYRRMRLEYQAGSTKLGEAEEAEHSLDAIFGIVANVVLVSALTFEVHDWFIEAARSGRATFADMRMARLASYSILWAVYAAAVVVGGFVLRYSLFRILGLAAFVPILAKVFLVDLSELELLPRVLAFAVLGVMLLAVSALYQKFSARIAEA